MEKRDDLKRYRADRVDFAAIAQRHVKRERTRKMLAMNGNRWSMLKWFVKFLVSKDQEAAEVLIIIICNQLSRRSLRNMADYFTQLSAFCDRISHGKDTPDQQRQI